MKTLGLLTTIMITLPLSACMHRERCDSRGEWCDDSTAVQVCFYDSDCAAGYHCNGGSCVSRPPIPPPRGDGGATGSEGSDGVGGSHQADAGVDSRPLDGGATGQGGSHHADAGAGGAAGSGSIDARGSGGAAGSGQPPSDGGTTPTCDAGAGGGSCHPHPVPVCQFDHQCGLSGRCADGACQASCATNSDCGTGQVCTQGYCVTPSTSGGQCLFNADCGAGRTCINGYCHPACQADTDCPAHDRCVANICQPDTGPHPQCRSNGDCTGVHVTEDVCVDAVCRSECTSDADCCVGSSGSICQMGYCVTTHEVAPQCRLDTDCGAAGACIDAVCE
jgi:Cys-rich repeat protein